MATNNKFIAACIQLNSQNNLEDNITKAKNLITQAAKAGANFIALPENAFYMAEKYLDLLKISGNMKAHPAVLAMQKIASELNIFLQICVAVLPENIPIENIGKQKLANRSIIISSIGEIISYYDKIHLFDAVVKNDQTYTESESFISGDKAVITNLPWGKVGQTICYDVRFASIFRTLAKSGAEFITAPAAFTYKTGAAHWHILLRARAIENGCYIIAAGQCGNHPRGRKTFGHSIIINPWGQILAEASEDNEEFILAEIDASMVNEIRNNMPSLKHDKNFTLDVHQ